MTGTETTEPTLGERLDVAARTIAARHQVQYAWASGLVPVLRRAARLIESPGGRFERREAAGDLQFPAVHTGQQLPLRPGRSGHALRQASAEASAPPATAADVENPATVLPADTRAQLSDIAGPGAGLLRVRADAAADSLSRAHRADAVTTGTDVYFRAGMYRPREPEGFALLAHEAAHVTALLEPGRPWRRAAADGGDSGDEDAALAAETAALQQFGQAPGSAVAMTGPASGRPSAIPPLPPPGAPRQPRAADLGGVSPAAAPAQARPMRASVDRDTGQPPPVDVEALRRSLIADLMRQLRSDFERGG
jgi:hypothetical protein